MYTVDHACTQGSQKAIANLGHSGYAAARGGRSRGREVQLANTMAQEMPLGSPLVPMEPMPGQVTIVVPSFS